MSECLKELCKLLKEHYERLDRELARRKDELGCIPLCEERYPDIRSMAATLDVLYELIRAVCD